MAKKAKPKRRVLVPMWLVRDEEGDYYMFISHKMPIKDKAGQWRVGSLWRRDLLDSGNGTFEAAILKKYHLKPGGGPKKVKLVGA